MKTNKQGIIAASIIAMLCVTQIEAEANLSKVTVPVVPIEENSMLKPIKYYMGVGAGKVSVTEEGIGSISNIKAYTLIGGISLGKFAGLEARYKQSMGINTYAGDTEEDVSLSAYSIFAKPRYSFGDTNTYLLLGYGMSELTIGSIEEEYRDFQWGGGIEYTFTNHFSIFADYTKIYEGKEKLTKDAESATFGFIYNF